MITVPSTIGPDGVLRDDEIGEELRQAPALQPSDNVAPRLAPFAIRMPRVPGALQATVVSECSTLEVARSVAASRVALRPDLRYRDAWIEGPDGEFIESCGPAR